MPDTGTKPIRLVIFDKDGTLLDYSLTWDRAVHDVLAWATNAPQYPDSWSDAAQALHFDLVTRTAQPTSPLIAESGEVVAGLLWPFCDVDRVPDRSALATLFSEKGLEYATPVPGAGDLLVALTELKIFTAIATNDDEAATAATVEALGWGDTIGWVVGADSGFGAKPDPGMVIAALAHFGVDPAEAIMIGDTGHDVAAAQRAGVRAVLIAPDSDRGLETDFGADAVVRGLQEVLPLLAAMQDS